MLTQWIYYKCRLSHFLFIQNESENIVLHDKNDLVNKVNTLEPPLPLLLGIGIFTRSLLFFSSIVVMGNSVHIVGFSVTELSSQRQLSLGELIINKWRGLWAWRALLRGILLLWVFAFVQREILFWQIVLQLLVLMLIN